ncbi:hypothetical protein IC620_10995 [Hazenella sp. IB182357]|uniref:Uncharacterized protein n=1 Tax=Polycladospora coralii TaxID=2771432 RepID=A0A926NB34_9BACL|nr:hypothetical protein [Polycladospora coralii]MBD1372882.1 hypothetical protein [Polycladospora coralii]
MDFAENVQNGNFINAFEQLKSLSEEKFEKRVVSVAFELENISAYFFMLSVIEKSENAFHHYIASVVLSTALSHLTGAYHAGLYHARKAIELAPDEISYKEYLLLFHDIPERLVSSQEAFKLSLEILKVNPTRQRALELKMKLQSSLIDSN